MANNAERIVIDTNLWISFLISNKFKILDQLLSNRDTVVLFSNELLSEFTEVIGRPKFKKSFSKENTDQVLNSIQYVAEFISVRSRVEVCRDVKDNFLLALSKDGDADFLITGDNDLLAVKQFHKTKIISFSDYLKLKNLLKAHN